MNNLSPAAKAVLDAANNENSYTLSSIGPDDCLNESRWIATAVLRATADQLCLNWAELSHPADVLNNIADELEAHSFKK